MLFSTPADAQGAGALRRELGLPSDRRL